MFRSFLFRSVSVSALALLPVSARAQVADPQAQDEIVVTGEKAERSLQETVSSVAVTTARRIDEENIQTVQEIYQRTANMAETYGASGFTIRGIADRGIAAGGDAPLATVYVDGTALPREILSAAPTDSWDVQQVEIFRGPQSTLQGLNALAGAVVIRTRDPGMDWDIRARASVSEYSTTQFAIAAGGPIVPGELAFRVSADKRDSDGFVRNITRDVPEAPVDTLNIRGKLLWTPSALPGFEARAGYTRFEGDGAYMFAYTETDRPNFWEDRVNASDFPNASSVRADIGNLELSYEIASGLSLTSVSNYSEVAMRRSYDGDDGPESIGYGENPADYQTWSQELRLNYKSGPLSGLLGLFYYNRDQHSRTASRTLVPTPGSTITALLMGNGLDAATAGFVSNLYVTALPAIPVQYSSDFPMQVETWAVFGDGKVALTDRLSLLGGFRYDRETNHVQVTQNAEFAGTFPDPAAFGPVGSPLYLAVTGINMGVQGLVNQASGATPPAKRTFEAFLPKAGIEMQWTDDVSTAFVVQRGYRSGGTTANTARSQAFAYDPEYTWNYELSFRSQWLDGRLTLNANAFYVDWKDQQTSANFGLNLYDYHTVNAGKSHLYGFEIEASHRVNRAFDWYASLGHVRTKFDEFTTDVGTVTDLSGIEFPYTPRWTLSGGANFRFADGFAFNLNTSHRSAVFTDAVKPQDGSRVGARTLVNARLGYTQDKWGVSVFVSNLLDERYMQYDVTAQRGIAVLGAPRVVGAALDLRL
ncbi:TonB-dependent receptor [Sphingomonas sp. BT-65]|uniref:TonB-dependent receptor n=1 Tax=Sphingomonas sp. BT-65 TaxID=2989821 RepID=UPI002235B542|nr:TonB-dependent receptor [Sphingomonas sp. BT-65]MCW4463508.1 TonB-dependent receptor [Sphingomonas sp. BT-65]